MRNLAPAVKNPIQEMNKHYSKTINSIDKNRPFSSKSDYDKFTVVNLVLLPHQVIIFPKQLGEQINILTHMDSIRHYDKFEIR